jgi:hypothetical protein
MQAEVTDTYRTIDLDLAAFLLAKNIPLAGFNHEGQRLSFVFKSHSECTRLQQQYESGDDTLSAHTILVAAKRLRNLVRQNL